MARINKIPYPKKTVKQKMFNPYGNVHMSSGLEVNRHVFLDEESGEAYVPLSIVEQLMVDNEMYKEMIWAEQDTDVSKFLLRIKSYCDASSSEVIRGIKHIAHKLNISEKKTWELTYKIMGDMGIPPVPPADCRKEKSKLQWYTNNGYLPFLSFFMTSLSYAIVYRVERAKHESKTTGKTGAKGRLHGANAPF